MKEQENRPQTLADYLPGHIVGMLATAAFTYGMLNSSGLPETLNAAMAVSTAVINYALYREVFKNPQLPIDDKIAL